MEPSLWSLFRILPRKWGDETDRQRMLPVSPYTWLTLTEKPFRFTIPQYHYSFFSNNFIVHTLCIIKSPNNSHRAASYSKCLEIKGPILCIRMGANAPLGFLRKCLLNSSSWSVISGQGDSGWKMLPLPPLPPAYMAQCQKSLCYWQLPYRARLWLWFWYEDDGTGKRNLNWTGKVRQRHGTGQKGAL